MSTLLDELLANATAPTIPSLKQQSVAAASGIKQAALGGNQITMPTAAQLYAPLSAGQEGVISASPVELDARTLGPQALIDKYGHTKAIELISNIATANAQIGRDQAQQRDYSQAAADVVSGVGLGAAQAIGGAAALPIGLVSQDAGKFISNKLEGLADFTHENQSPALQARRRLLAGTDQMSKRDSDLQYQQDKAAGAGISADFARIGRGVVDGIVNAAQDPITLSDGIAEAGGSFLALGPVARAATAAKTARATAAGEAAILGGKSIDEAAAITKGIMAKDGLSIPLAIGAMEAGGAFTGNVNEINNMSYEDLYQKSPAFKNMVDSGVDPEEAKTTLANRAGLLAGALAFPTAVAAGHLVKGFEGKIGTPSTIAALRNIGKETIEEGSQGGTGTIAQNIGVNAFADKNRTISENVGEQVGRGALYGAGMAGVLAAPRVGVDAVSSIGSGAIGLAGSAISKIAEDRRDANMKASPASIDRVAEKATTAQEQAPAARAELAAVMANAEPEIKAKVEARFEGMLNALSLSEQELANPVVAATGATNKPEAIQKLSQTVLAKDASLGDRLNALFAIAQLDIPVDAETADMAQEDYDALETPVAGAVQGMFSNYINTITGIGNSPEMAAVTTIAKKLLSTNTSQAELNDPNVSVDAIKKILVAAKFEPEKVNSKVAGIVLSMAKEGKISLPAHQIITLRSASILMEAAEQYDADLINNGLKSKLSAVQVQVKTGNNDLNIKSARQHMEGITTAVAAGNTVKAVELLNDFGTFVTSQNNKLEAIQKSFNESTDTELKKFKYMTISGDGSRTTKESANPVGVTPKSADSVNFVQKVAAEARFLTDLYNGLAQEHGLQVEPMTFTPLPEALQGKPAVVASEFSTGIRKRIGKPATPSTGQSGSQVPTGISGSATPPTVAPTATVTPTPSVNPTGSGTDTSGKQESVEKTTPTEKTLPWEGEESPETRKAKEEAGIPLSVAEAAATSIGSTTHDLAAETSFIEALLKLLNISVDFGGVGKTTEENGAHLDTTDNTIYIEDKYTSAARLSVLLHETGHLVTFAKIAEVLKTTVQEVAAMSDKDMMEEFRKIVPEIVTEYENWLKQFEIDKKKIEFSKKTGNAHVERKNSSMSRVVLNWLLEGKTKQERTAILNAPRKSSFSEWIADNIAKALEDNTKSRGIVKQFFKDIADTIVNIYKNIKRSETLKGFLPAKSVAEWVNSLQNIQANATSLIEVSEHSASGYRERTKHNADSAGATVAFAKDFTTAGERLTANVAKGKIIQIDILSNPDVAAKQLIKHMQNLGTTTLNVAGNGIYTLVKQIPNITQAKVNQQIFDILVKVHETIEITNIVTGGQTGVDIAGAVAAKALGIPVSVTMPKGFLQRNEQGKDFQQSREDVVKQIEEGANNLQKTILVTPPSTGANSSGSSQAPTTPPTGKQVVPTAPTPPVEVAPVTKVEITEDTTLNDLFPDLVSMDGKYQNYLGQAYKIPKTPISRLLGYINPIQAVRDAFADGTLFGMGKGANGVMGDTLLGAYNKLLGTAEKVAETLTNQLNIKLSEKNQFMFNSLEGTRTDTEVTSHLNTKVTNLVQITNGVYAYNPYLIEAAVLAGMHWLQNASSTGSIKDFSDAAKIYGVDEEQVTYKMLNAINSNLLLLDVEPALRNYIINFWGFKKNNSFGDDAVEGIVSSIAVELLRAMVTKGLIEQGTLEQEGTTKTPNTFTIKNESIITGYNTLLGDMLLTEPEELNWYEDERPPVPETQMNSPEVNNTSEQKEAIKAESNTDTKLNQFTNTLIEAMGLENVLDAFSDGNNVDPLLHNKMHLESKLGRIADTRGAFNHIAQEVAKLGHQAIKYGKKITDVVIHRAYNMSVVGRMQMLGKYNEQANKLARIIFSPTESTMSLEEGSADMAMYRLALAQMVGIKVHQMETPQINKELVKFLRQKPIKKLLKVFGDHLKDGKWDTERQATLVAALSGSGDRTLAAQGLLDYARLSRAILAGETSFTTFNYLEADGVTNGPANAVMLLSSGKFTAANIKQMGMGGFFLDPTMTMGKYRSSQGSSEYYTEAALALTKELQSFNTALGKETDKKPQELQADFLMLMKMFLGDVGISFDEKTQATTYTFKRSLLKNPVTVTVYGAGTKGLSNKVYRVLIDEIYARMSEALQKKPQDNTESIALAMFGGDSVSTEDAVKSLNEFSRIMLNLTSNMVKIDKVGEKELYTHTNYSYIEFPTLNTRAALRIYALEKFPLTVFVNNISMLYTPALQAGINSTIGADVVEVTNVIRDATQLQSQIMALEFTMGVQSIIDVFRADKKRRKKELLSKKDQQELINALIQKYPFIKAPMQTFFPAGSANSDVKAEAFATTLTDTFKVQAYVRGPTDSGVAAIPYLVIGMGDGLAMQKIAVAPDGPKGTLKIFDGMNMPLHQIKQGSEVANRAVAETWQGNPMRAVLESFKKAYPHMIKFAQENYEEFPKKLKSGFTQIDDLLSKMERIANGIDARHAAMQRVHYAVDQLAAANFPHKHLVGTDISSLDPEEQADYLQKLYLEELETIEKNQAIAEEKAAATKAKREAAAAKRKAFEEREAARAKRAAEKATKTLTLTRDMLVRMTRADQTDLSDDQKMMLKQVLRLAGVSGYTVHYGTRENIEATHGVSLGKNEFGRLDSGTKNIYVVTGSSESIVHELIHAATFEVIQQYLINPNGDFPDGVGAAIERLLAMKDQFLALDTSEWSREAVVAYHNAKAAMQQHAAMAETEGRSAVDIAIDKAAELNEMMAWVLANQDLTNATKGVTATFLSRITKAVKAFFQKLLSGGNAVSISDSFYSTLRFNTLSIINTQPTQAEIIGDISLSHSATYGNDDYLKSIDLAIQKKISSFAKKPIQVTKQSVNSTTQGQASILYSLQLGIAVNNIFKMTPQEYSTFEKITGILSTEAAIDPAALVKAQELYTHAIKHLKVNSFMVDKQSNNPNDAQQSLDKYELLTGKSTILTDINGRSSLLPVFLALATTNEDMRTVLADIPMPESVKHLGNTFDTHLRNTGNKMMDGLSAWVSGTRKSKNVSDAIEALNTRLYDLAEQKEGVLEGLSSGLGGVTDTVNDRITKTLTRLGDAAYAKAGAISAGSNSRVVKTASTFVQAASLFASQKVADDVALGVSDFIAKTSSMKPLTEFLNDVIGRTSKNAVIYDMIKATRAGVQQLRQIFRDTPPDVIASKFSREVTKEEWESLNTSMAKTDLAALRGKYTFAEIGKLFTNNSSLKREISKLENTVSKATGTNWNIYQRKMQQYVNYINTGEVGNNLLRNAHAISKLLGENAAGVGASQVENIDQLMTLYAIDSLSKEDVEVFSSLVPEDSKGLEFTLAYLDGQRKEEMKKALSHDAAQDNYFKGYIPAVPTSGYSLRVVDDAMGPSLLAQSYKRIGDYEGTAAEGKSSKGYYFLPVSARADVSQGILQSVVQTAGGVNVAHGISTHLNAGVILDPREVKRIWQRAQRDNRVTAEGLIPIYKNGTVVALERTLSKEQLDRLQSNTQLHKMVGVWRGRQIEELSAHSFNESLIRELNSLYKNAKPGELDQYIDIFTSNDPVLKDVIKLFSAETIELMRSLSGTDAFFVNRNMVMDAFGYRDATVGDFWTGNSRWSPKTQEAVRDLAMAFMGNEAYRILANTERVLVNFVDNAKKTIIVKSVIVPAANSMANLYQLVARGVPLLFIKKKLPEKIQEIDFYVKSSIRLAQIEAELRADKSAVERVKLESEVTGINDAHKRLSIWPLLQAGEFSSISDVGLTHEDVDLFQGKWVNYIENQVDKLPDSIRNAGRYAVITHDTALYQGLQKAVQYGDFLGKAILYDDLVSRKKMSSEDALARITEEFVNFDRLPGRFRGTLEKMGMLWFYNFKIRIMKVGMSIVRNNPLHALLAGLIPGPDVGSPVTDNLAFKAVEGSLDNSIGIGMGLNAPYLLPIVNIIH